MRLRILLAAAAAVFALASPIRSDAASITITAGAVGTIVPTTALFPATVANGDFTIAGNAVAPLAGDGVDDTTRWTFDFSGDPDLASFHAATGPLTAASLTLSLVPRDALITTDVVRIETLSDIVTPAIQGLPVDAVAFVALDLLDFYSPDDILAALGGLATLPMVYADDAVVFQSVINLTRVTESVPAPGSIALALVGLGCLLVHRARRLAVAALFAVVFAAAPAQALVVTLGDQDFADGTFLTPATPFGPPSAGEPAPFDAFRGDDNDTDFSASWTFNFPAAAYATAVLRLGIVDHDSAAPGSQVSAFTIDGHDATALIDAIFESRGGGQPEANVYDVPIPALLLGELSDGVATFDLTLEGITISSIGIELPNNGAGLDFAQLLLDETPVPVPPGIALLLPACAGLLVGLRRRAAATRDQPMRMTADSSVTTTSMVTPSRL